MDEIQRQINEFSALIGKPDEDLKPNERFMVKMALKQLPKLYDLQLKQAEEILKQADHQRKLQLIQIEEAGKNAELERRKGHLKVTLEERQLDLKADIEFGISTALMVGKAVIARANEIQLSIDSKRLEEVRNSLECCKVEIGKLDSMTDDDIKKEFPHKKTLTEEFMVQYRFLKLFEVLVENKLINELHFADTSASSRLESRSGGNAKCDLSFYASLSFLWVHAVSFGELKSSFDSTNSYHQAVGQLIDRFSQAKTYQPGRELFMGFVGSRKHVQIIKQDKSDLYLSEKFHFAFDINNSGLLNLVSLYVRPISDFGFKKLYTILKFKSSDESCPALQNFEAINIHTHRTKIFSAVLASDPERRYVIKVNSQGVGNGLSIEKERRNLEALKSQSIENVPHFLYDASIDLGDSEMNPHRAIVMEPFGYAFNVDSCPFKTIVTCFLDIVKALRDVYEKCTLLYTDISPTNMLIYLGEDGYEHGLLIDWESAIDINAGFGPQRIATTATFTPLRHMRALVTGAIETFLVRDVVESLFYTLIFICSGDRVPWKHCGGYIRTMESLKFTSIFGRFKALLQQVHAPYRKVILELRNLLFQTSQDSRCILSQEVGFDDVIKILRVTLSGLGGCEDAQLYDEEFIGNIEELVAVFEDVVPSKDAMDVDEKACQAKSV